MANYLQPYGKLWQWAYLPCRWHILISLCLACLITVQSAVQYQRIKTELTTISVELQAQQQKYRQKQQVLTMLAKKRADKSSSLKQKMATVVPTINRQLLAYVAQFPHISYHTPQWQFDNQTTLGLQFSGAYLTLEQLLPTLFDQFDTLTPIRLTLQPHTTQHHVFATIDFYIIDKELQ
ncbi:hypothetical protein [Spirabiliibacterium falconis]|uniref:hypothetical protein n=1 Tax=Spirabiliibacterium falconis TaxID=572023 RepID=UPI001AAC7395|nr:hypothetical protein [Spirabiliibacterium falconis]MBE2894925.1 hypothetical protein [Spirabiliibacterium falconis]